MRAFSHIDKEADYVRKKKWLSVVLSLVLLMTVLPATAYGYEVTQIESDGPNAGKEAYAIFQDHMGPSPVDGPGATNIHEGYDDIIGNHFVFHIEEDEAYDGCCTDRQRLELKGYNSSPDEVKAKPGDTFTYNWFFRANEDEFAMSQGGSFNHIFQLKMVGGDAGAPVLTFSLADGELLFRHSPIGETMNEVEVLQRTDWSDVVNKWVFASVTVENVDQKDADGNFIPGQIEMSLRNLDGSVIMEWSGARETWREGGEFNRPKWGIYRAVFPGMGPATLRFADFEIIHHDWPDTRTFQVNPTGDTHIEAEDFSSKQGYTFDKSCLECSDGAYMSVPSGWDDAAFSEYLNYRLALDEASTEPFYLHLYGQGDAEDSNTVEVSLSDTGAGTAVELPVGEWGWSTIPIDLTEGTTDLYVKLLETGAKLDKLALNTSPEPPAVAVMPKLDTLTVNGEPLVGFASNVYAYTFKHPFGAVEVPIVEASSQSGEVTIEGPDSMFGEAVVTVSNPAAPSLDVQYTINFTGFPYPENLPEPFEFVEIVDVTATGAHSSGPAQGAIDRDMSTKWTVGGNGPSITFDLGEVQQALNHLIVAFMYNDAYVFDVELSEDGEDWTRVLTGATSSEDGDGIPQIYPFKDTDARYVRYIARGATDNHDGWTNVMEVFVGKGPSDPNLEYPEQPLIPPTLSEIRINGESLQGFEDDKFAYTYDWPLGNTEIPTVSAESEHHVVVEQAEDLFGTAVITVTHNEHEDVSVEYTVQFQGLRIRDNTELPAQFTAYDVEEVTYSNQHGSHPASNSVDGSRGTRWAVSVSGGPEWVQYDLDEAKSLQYVLASHLNAHNRALHFKLELSEDGEQWQTVYDGDSSVYENDPATFYNEGEDLELFTFERTTARYVRYTGDGATTVDGDRDTWHNLIEIVIGGEIPPTMTSIQQWLDHYIASGDIQMPLSKQLTNSLKQAIHHDDSGREQQAIKHLEKFQRQLNHPPMQQHRSAEAAELLDGDITELLELWSEL